MPKEENELIDQEEDESENEEDEALGEGIDFFAPPNRKKNLTTKQKLKANKERSFTKKKKFKNKFNLPKCLNTYGGCQNKPRPESNFCSEICKLLYEGRREFQRPNNYYIKFFEREKTRQNEQVNELVKLKQIQIENNPILETK